MIGIVRKPISEQGLVWYYWSGDGRGSKVFVGTGKAEELMREGIPVFCTCKVQDL